jgi:hypothetical protein
VRADDELAIAWLRNFGFDDSEVAFLDRAARAGRKQNLNVFHVETPQVWATLCQLSERCIGWWVKP